MRHAEVSGAPAFVQRAVAALRGLEDPEDPEDAVDPAEPLRFAIHRISSALDGPRAVEPLLAFLESRVAGSWRGESRYRWELTHRVGVKLPRYAPSVQAWTAWRAGQVALLARDPFEVEAHLLVPIVITENLEVLLDTAAGAGPLAARARVLLDEAVPIARRDIARYIAENHLWGGTFALWCLTRVPRTLDLMHPLTVALAITYAAGQTAPVRGNQFPYYGKPLASASAHVASSLLRLGIELDVAAELVRCVGDLRRASGGWGDDDSADPLTTVIAAELLARTDPSFDLTPTLGYFEATQHPDGLWRALGPEAPWLTAEIAVLACAARQPFAVRFRWPHCGRALLDQKTGVPFFSYFIDVANLLAAVAGLASSAIELAFIDLIGFRVFNNRYGQDAGDEVLRLFATQLKTIPCARVVRDGGDEFLVLAAPQRGPLADDLGAFMAAWKGVFHERFGADVPSVAPRIVVGLSTGADLRRLRQWLGREITRLKELATIPEMGVLVTADG